MHDIRIQFIKTSKNAICPTNATRGSAGLDLYASECIIIPSGQLRLVATDVALIIPDGYLGLIQSRSSLALKKLITCTEVLGCKSEEAVNVGLLNLSENDFSFKKGDRIAQVLILPSYTINIEEIHADYLGKTVRSAGKFGSTGP